MLEADQGDHSNKNELRPYQINHDTMNISFLKFPMESQINANHSQPPLTDQILSPISSLVNFQSDLAVEQSLKACTTVSFSTPQTGQRREAIIFRFAKFS